MGVQAEEDPGAEENGQGADLVFEPDARDFARKSVFGFAVDSGFEKEDFRGHWVS